MLEHRPKSQATPKGTTVACLALAPHSLVLNEGLDVSYVGV